VTLETDDDDDYGGYNDDDKDDSDNNDMKIYLISCLPHLPYDELPSCILV
jgi:hypothetical protein